MSVLAGADDGDTLLTRSAVFITGAHGFLGRHLVEHLRARGCERLLTPTFAELDLRMRDDVRSYLQRHKPDVVIHLAARVGGIGANKARPAELFHDNLIMGTQLIDEAWRAGVKKLVATATVCAYPKHTPVPFREETLWDGYPEDTNAPYGLAKKMLIVQSQAYRQQHGFNSVVLLPVNLFGPGDNFDLETSHVIPAIIRKIDGAIRRGEPTVTVWGDGSASREFLYVEDCARAVALAVDRYDASEPVNLGTGEEVRIRDLVERIAAALRFEGRILWDVTKPNGQPRRSLDVTRARERFGFTASVSFAEGLRRTLEWWDAEGRTLIGDGR